MSDLRVAILSAGPSLTQTFDPDAHHTVRIGVNAAVEAYECEWWAAGDLEAYRAITPIGRPGLYTKSTTLAQMETKLPRILDGRPTLAWKTAAEGLGKLPATWSVYSAPAALVLAVHLRAASVDVYGADMNGDCDYAGRFCRNRNEERWANERNIWNQVRRWAESLGVPVRRFHPGMAKCRKGHADETCPA